MSKEWPRSNHFYIQKPLDKDYYFELVHNKQTTFSQ